MFLRGFLASVRCTFRVLRPTSMFAPSGPLFPLFVVCANTFFGRMALGRWLLSSNCVSIFFHSTSLPLCVVGCPRISSFFFYLGKLECPCVRRLVVVVFFALWSLCDFGVRGEEGRAGWVRLAFARLSLMGRFLTRRGRCRHFRPLTCARVFVTLLVRLRFRVSWVCSRKRNVGGAVTLHFDRDCFRPIYLFSFFFSLPLVRSRKH